MLASRSLRKNTERNTSASQSDLEQKAETLTKTQLEVKRLQEELEHLTAKTQLEIAKLKRETGIGRTAEILLDKWVPTLVASILLFTAVPLSNDTFWRSQKSIDIGISTLTKMREAFSKLSLITTQFMQTVERIDILKCKDDPSLDRKGVALECASLRKDRYAVEPQIVGTLSDVDLYFSAPASEKVRQIKSLYNALDRKTPDKAFVTSFGKARAELLDQMRSDIRAKEQALLS